MISGFEIFLLATQIKKYISMTLSMYPKANVQITLSYMILSHNIYASTSFSPFFPLFHSVNKSGHDSVD